MHLQQRHHSQSDSADFERESASSRFAQSGGEGYDSERRSSDEYHVYSSIQYVQDPRYRDQEEDPNAEPMVYIHRQEGGRVFL